MPFPEFEPEKKRILFFSRGRGRGHAIPDFEIIQALYRLRADVCVRVVSYGTGAATFADRGMPVIDIDVPETGPIAEISVLAGKLVGWLNPDLVVSHEEFAAVPAARIFDKRVVSLTDWFTDPTAYSMNALKFADQILFLGAPGVFDEPPWLHDKIRYLGAILRKFQYGVHDKARARRELSIPEEAFVLSVFPGSWREADAPILETVIGAFDAIVRRPKHLVWIAGLDADAIRSRCSGRNDVLILEHTPEIDRVMAATDVAITKANRKTVLELAYLGVPSIAISYNLNPPDDLVVASLRSPIRVDGREIDAARLIDRIEAACSAPPPGEHVTFCPVERCAELLAAELRNDVLHQH